MHRAFFTATCENKKFHYGAFFLPTLLPLLTELSKVFLAEYFNLAQMKASIELCIIKLSDATAKSVLKANWGRFESELRELRTLDGFADSCA